jgi:hypothetical protein
MQVYITGVKDVYHHGPAFSSFWAVSILNKLDLKEFIFIGKDTVIVFMHHVFHVTPYSTV